jgi:uracil-DNA glycosylase family 4
VTATDSWERLNAEIVACRACPRLVAWREEVARVKRRAFQHETYWGRPVPGFGDPQARLVIIGLAPAAHGANRAGRMFSGDSSARTLIPAMHRAGFANQDRSERPGDGLILPDAFLTAVCRCAPPKNRPNAEELGNCRPYLARELALLTRVQVVLALGRVAFDGYLRLCREQGRATPRLSFRHGAVYRFEPPFPTLLASYHPSRQNTNTGRLTVEMLDAVFAEARRMVDATGVGG